MTCHLQTVVCKCCFSYMNKIDCVFLAKYPILSQGEHQTTLLGGWEGKDWKKRVVFLFFFFFVAPFGNGDLYFHQFSFFNWYSSNITWARKQALSLWFLFLWSVENMKVIPQQTSLIPNFHLLSFNQRTVNKNTNGFVCSP